LAHTILNIGVARQIGSYSDAVAVGPNLRWLFTSGTPGLSATGELSRDISGQAELAWAHPLSYCGSLRNSCGLKSSLRSKWSLPGRPYRHGLPVTLTY